MIKKLSGIALIRAGMRWQPRGIVVFVMIVAVLAFAGTAGCDRRRAVDDDDAAHQVPGLTSESVYGEAPRFAELVATGALPPVDERLPVNPVIVEPVERVGVYGGTWRMGATSSFNRPV